MPDSDEESVRKSAAATDLDGAKKYRAIKRQLFTKCLNKCKVQIKADKLSLEKGKELTENWKKLSRAHQVVLTFCKDEEEILADNYLDDLDDEYDEVREKLKGSVEKQSEKTGSSKGSTSGLDKLDVARKKVDAPKFTGDISEYYIWRTNFRKNFESKSDKSIAMLQLLEALGEEQRKKVSHLTIDGDIEEMFKILDMIYGDRRKICQVIMEEVKSIPPCRINCVGDFKHLHDVVTLTRARLKSIKCESYLNHFNSVETLEKKLPPEYKEKWAVIAVSAKVSVENVFEELLEFIEQQVLVAEQLDRMRCESDFVLESASYYASGGYAGGGEKWQPNSNSGGEKWQPNSNSGLSDMNRCPLHAKAYVNHSVGRCYMLKAATALNQAKWLNGELNQYCRICLRKGHGVSGGSCKATIWCRKCNGKHFEWLHEALDIVRPDDKASDKCYLVGSNQVLGRYRGNAICPAQYGNLVFGANQNSTVSILYDCGANVSMIRQDLADKLNLQRMEKHFLCFSTVSGEEIRVNTHRYRVKLSNLSDPEKSIEIVAFGIPRIGADFPSLPGGLRSAASKLGVMDVYDQGRLSRPVGKLDVLIGADFAQVMPIPTKPSVDGLILAKNQLGYVVYGSHPSFMGAHPSHYRAQVLRTEEKSEFEHKLGDFFSTESLGIEVSVKCGDCKCGKCAIGTDVMTLREQQELELVKGSMVHDPSSRTITAAYPPIRDLRELGNNYPMVRKSLVSLEKDLSRNSELEGDFATCFQDMIDRGVIKKLTKEELDGWDGPVNYLPMQYVLKPSSSSTPLRIVMDTARKFENKCVSDFWAKGPNLIANALGLLIRFREGFVAILGDIAKMYNTIHTTPVTWHLHRILWRDLEPDREPDTYVVVRNSFGSKPAGLVAILGLHMVADLGSESVPRGARCLREQMYVDDCMDSCDSVEEAKSVTNEVDQCLALASFKVKEWKFVGASVVSPNVSGADAISVCSSESVLGVKLNLTTDSFVFQSHVNFSKKRRRSTEKVEPDLVKGDIYDLGRVPILSKRMVASFVMTIHDPMGLLGPLITVLKTTLAGLWKFRYPDHSILSWDDPLPSEFDAMFREFIDASFDLCQIDFPRCLKPVDVVGQPWLILCSDSSTKCFGAVAYVRWQKNDGEFWVRIIASKSRVWPVEPDDYISIVRGELQGAVMAKRLAQFIMEESRFLFERVIFLVDSEIVRAQIASNSHAFDVFVGRRVAEIRKNTDASQWFWVSGKRNESADLLTRGTTNVSKFDRDSAWQCGPKFLYDHFADWPVHQSLSNGTVLPEMKSKMDWVGQSMSCLVCEDASWADMDQVVNVCLTDANQDDRVRRQLEMMDRFDLSRFGNLFRLHLVTARAWHMLQWTPDKGQFLVWCCKLECIDAHSLEDAEIMWFHYVQKDLKQELKVGKFKKVIPFYDDQGVLRANGRFKEGEGYHPVILPSEHPYTRLQVVKIHERGHNGVTTTMAKVRDRFHIPNLHRIATMVRKKCVTCKILDHRLEAAPMAKLPSSRIRPYHPFEHISVDIFGPYMLAFPGKITRGRSVALYGKGYGVLFSCLATRAVHIEAIEGCSTDAFLLGFRRMMSMRGQPRSVWSDNGGQLVAADVELRALVEGWDQNKLSQFGASEGIQWTFAAPGAPWQNGITEALIKSAKRAISAVLTDKPKIPIMELQTLFCEVASLLNERPLNAALLSNSPDVEAGTYLCPNQLLYGRASSRIPAGPYRPVHVSDSRRFQVVQGYVNEWWDKWSMEVLPTLLRQSKWFDHGRTVKKGDIVHVKDLNPIRGEWKIAEVTEAIPSDDDIVRNVTLRYKTPGPLPGGHLSYRGSRDRTEIRDVKTLVVIVPAEERTDGS